MTGKRSPTKRAVKFWIINHLLLPVGLVLLRLLVLTWRLDRRGTEDVRRALRDHERLVVATWHGMSLGLMLYVRIMKAEGRTVTVMTSPSRDGQVMDAVVRRIGLRVVKGSSASRASAGTFALVNEIESGHVGLIAVDGPRGPVTVPKPGFIRIAQATGAHAATIVVGARHAIRFHSWDRIFLPLPFSTVAIRLRTFSVPGRDEPEEKALAALRRQLLEEGGRVPCPIASRRES